MMESKERVERAIRRQPADRVPVFMWYHPDTATRLSRELGVPAESVAAAMGNDIDMTWVNNNHAMEGITHANEGDGHSDEWGIRWEKRGAFNQIVAHPVAEDDAINGYRFPYGQVDALVALLAPVVSRRGDRFIGCDVSPCAFEMHNRLRGMEASLIDLATGHEASLELLGECARFAAELAQIALERYDLDMLWTGDDVASQTALMMSPQMWRRHIKPHLRRVVDVGRRRGVFVAYHSCGAVRNIIPDLIDIGVQALNPIQPHARDMDPAGLKADFGRDLVFIGGVDTQDLLPNASASEVRRYTEDLVATMTSDGGGYILGASHTIPPETPLDNIFAMFEAVGLTEEEIRDGGLG